MASTASRLRTHAFGLAKVYGCPMDVEVEERGRWRVAWTDGPSLTLVISSFQREFPDLTGIRYGRDHERRPLMLGALRAVAAATEERLDQLTHPMWGDLESAARTQLDDVTDPWENATTRERAMVDQLLTRTARRDYWGDGPFEDTDAAFAELLRRRGVAWLLEPAPEPTTSAPARQVAPDGPADALVLTPLEFLTDRYAAEADRRAWEQDAQPMPASRLFAQAADDTGIGKAEALTALGLAAEVDAREARLIDAARAAGASWTEVGTVLGMTKQSASERRNRLSAASSPTGP